MATTAAILYWIIVTIWVLVLGCTLRYGTTKSVVIGSARVLLLVVALDTVRDIIENVYFGMYFGSQYGLFDKGIGSALGQPLLLMLPKFLNIAAGLAVLFILLLSWFPKALQERSKLNVLASTDGMTQLNNRRQFDLLALAEFERAVRYARPLSLLIIDIDHFKAVNDRFGHDVGDRVIIDVAMLCRRSMRGNDIAGRLGGEEFGILLPETHADEALVFAERLRAEVAALETDAGSERLTVTISMGLASREDASTLEQLYKHADVALYEAKHAGRNRVCMHQVALAADGLADKLVVAGG